MLLVLMMDKDGGNFPYHGWVFESCFGVFSLSIRIAKCNQTLIYDFLSKKHFQFLMWGEKMARTQSK